MCVRYRVVMQTKKKNRLPFIDHKHLPPVLCVYMVHVSVN